MNNLSTQQIGRLATVILVLGLMILGLANAQGSPPEAWAVRYDSGESDWAWGIAVDSSDNVIVTGKSEGVVGGTFADFYTIKYDSDGNQLWAVSYDNYRSDTAYGVAVDSSDNVIVTGASREYYSDDFYTIKYDSDGIQLWAVRYDGGKGDYTRGVAVDSSDNVIVTGVSQVVSNPEFFTIKYDSNGNQLWNKSGGFGFAYGVAVDSADNVIVTGNEAGDFKTIKYDADGTVLWSRIYDSGMADTANGVAVDSSNNVIVTGVLYSGGDADFYTIKYDSSGNQLWAVSYDGGDRDEAHGVAVDSDDNVIVTGMSVGLSFGDFYTIKYDSSGNEIYNATYNGGGGDAAHAVAVDSSNNVIVTGSSSADFYTIKYALADGVVGPAGGTVVDTAGTGASFSVDAGVLPGDTRINIEVLADPGADPPAGFAAIGTLFVVITLDPPGPLLPPGATITLPLPPGTTLPAGTTLRLFKFEPDTPGTFIDTGIDGTVDGTVGEMGTTATFTGVTDFSIFVGLQPENQSPVGPIKVDADAPGPVHDGASWATAYNYLQEALAAASSGDEICVAQGAYKPDQGVGQTPGDRTATFQLKNGVALYGGFAGYGASDPDARDISAYETIFSGDLNGDDVGFTNNGENSYHVVTTSGVDETAILDGLTISGGNANGSPFPDCRGGGMYNDSSSPTLIDCTFSGNCAALGGGMCNVFESNPALTNCTFSGNATIQVAGIASSGGGMGNYQSNPILTNCTFSGNWADLIGGGMRNSGGSPKLTNCTFNGNSADGAGGGMGNSFGKPTLTNCTFSENLAIWQGGGIHNGGSSPTLTNCTFSGNSSDEGGGMYNVGCSPSLTLNNCTFSGNSADSSGGGMENYQSSPTLTNCMFSGNSAEYGGGMCNNFLSIPTVTNCTFSGNSAIYGGGIENWFYSDLTITNCILWGDSADSGSEIYNTSPSTPSTPTVTYSDIAGGWAGDGNIDADPMFADTDKRLSSGSPCIDAGNNTAVPPDTTDLDGDGDTAEPIPFDLDGNPRIVGAAVDMGAYESQVPSNRLPFVISVRTQSTDELSHAQWVFSSGTLMMDISFPSGTSDIVHPGDSQDNITFTITFSKPMISASLSIPGVTWASPHVTLTPNADATVFTGTLGGSAPAGTDPSGIYYLRIDGTDLAGNALAGRTSFASFDPQTALDPYSGATGTDNVHRFTIAINRDIVLLLDRSGSMASPSPGFSSKMAALKDAGNIFLDILIPSSNINLAGVKYDDVIEVLGPGCAMGPATANHISDIRDGINALTPRSMTSIAGGLIEAANQLSTVGDEKNLVLLFTDGKHNTSPPPPSVADGLATIHALYPDNTIISAIGFGTGANINIPQLQTIVSSTNGELWTTTSGLELHKFFIQALMNASGTPYSIFIADPTVTINHGQVKEHSFTIDSSDRQVAIVVEWGNTSGLMKISLRSPSPGDQIIKMSDAVTNSRILFSGGTSYALYQLTFPLGNTGTDPLANQWEGTWQVVVDATDTASGTHEYAYSVISSSELSVKLAVIGGNFTGDKLYLLAKLLYKGQPIEGRLSAVIDYPAISIPNKLASFEVSDDALAHYKIELRNKRAKDTPISAAEVYNYAVRQKYAEQVRFPRIRVRSKFTSMPPVRKIKLGPGEFVIEVPETKVAGDYQIIVQVNSVGYKQHSPRLAFLTHVVKPQVDSQATKIEVYSEKELRFLDTRKEYPLYVKVTPQDRFGNLIGAGLLDTKQFSVKTKLARIDSIVDRGDGTYIVALIPKKKIQSIPLRFIVQQKVKRVTITPNGRILEEKPRIKRSYRTLRETFGSSEPDSITPQSGSSQYLETTPNQGKGKK